MKNRSVTHGLFPLILMGIGVFWWPAGFALGQSDGDTFDDLARQWKETIVELDKLRHRHQLAEAKDQRAIRSEFDTLMEKARKLEPAVGAAIESQYRTNPKNRLELERILVARAIAAHSAQKEEEVIRLARLVIDGGCKIPHIFAYGVAVAVRTGEAELAATWANEAKKRKTGAERMPVFVEYALRAKQQLAGKTDPAKQLPRVKLETSMGDVVLELCEEEAPNTVANFVSLVESGFYDGLTFHRIIPQFMAQGGDPKGSGNGGPGYTIACECYQPDYRKHFRGSLSMAHAGQDTGGSQFFITFVPTQQLDGKHTAFGYVVSGFDTLDKLEAVGSKSGAPTDTPIIKKATVLNKRDHPYRPEKVGEDSK